MALLLHITARATWEDALANGRYEGDTLATEGFIHCSTPEQVVRVADARFRGRKGLVLLAMDSEKVQPEIRYEPAEQGELFPHIYGPLDADAVVKVVAFEPGPDGSFTLPVDISATSETTSRKP